MKKILVIMLAMAMLFNVGACGKAPSVCDGIAPDQSRLCNIANKSGARLEDIGNMLIVANLVAIEGHVYTKVEAIVVIKVILAAVDEGSTYNILLLLIKDKIQDNPGLLIVGEMFMANLAIPDVISPYDQRLLSSWLNKQLVLLGA